MGNEYKEISLDQLNNLPNTKGWWVKVPAPLTWEKTKSFPEGYLKDWIK